MRPWQLQSLHGPFQLLSDVFSGFHGPAKKEKDPQGLWFLLLPSTAGDSNSDFWVVSVGRFRLGDLQSYSNRIDYDCGIRRLMSGIQWNSPRNTSIFFAPGFNVRDHHIVRFHRMMFANSDKMAYIESAGICLDPWLNCSWNAYVSYHCGIYLNWRYLCNTCKWGLCEAYAGKCLSKLGLAWQTLPRIVSLLYNSPYQEGHSYEYWHSREEYWRITPEIGLRIKRKD